MTTEQPNVRRSFHRRSDDRVIGGVASGLGDFLNVDPLLIRIGFVGLMVFGGLGLVLYVLAWLVVPDEASGQSIAEQLLDRAGLNTSRVLLGALVAVGLFLFVGGLSNGLAMSGLATGLGVALVVIIVGAVILRQGEPGGTAAAPRAARPRQAPEMPADVAVSDRRAVRAARRRRPRSPLAGYVVGGMLAAIGLFALLTNASGADVELAQFFGVALGVVGIGLVVGAWWGHARVLILLGLLMLPFAVMATFLSVPIQGGIGDHRFTPTSVAELRDEYRMAAGVMRIDLRQLPATTKPVEIKASVAAGQLLVILPEDASVDVDSAVGAGDLSILGAYQAGTQLRDHHVVVGQAPRFVLHLEGGIGGINVDAWPQEWQ